jgi:hypothetical protein
VCSEACWVSGKTPYRQLGEYKGKKKKKRGRGYGAQGPRPTFGLDYRQGPVLSLRYTHVTPQHIISGGPVLLIITKVAGEACTYEDRGY